MDSNWIIAIATALYVVLTVFICVSNAISARAARKQTEELILQRELSFRPYIQISFEIIRGALLCFKIKNTGNQAAFETKVRVNDEFIQSLDDLEREGLGELNRAAFFLATNQELLFIIGGRTQFDRIAKTPAIFDISYCAGKYRDCVTIDLKQYSFALVEEDPLLELARSFEKYQKQSKQDNEKLREVVMDNKINEVVAVVRSENEHDLNMARILERVTIKPSSISQLSEALDLSEDEVILCLRDLSIRHNLVRSLLGINLSNPDRNSIWFRK